MFWRLGITRSGIDDLLDKENCSLSDILQEEDVIQECKGRNEKLLEFITSPENLTSLVEFAIEDSWRASGIEVECDLGQVACNLLSSDIDALESHIVSSEYLMNKIFNTVESPEPLDGVVASRFNKIASHLMARRGREVFEHIKTNNDTFTTNLVNHLGDESMDELLLRMVGIEAKEENPFGPGFPFSQLRMRESLSDSESKPDPADLAAFWLEKGLINVLISKFGTEQTPETYVNIAKVLSEIAKKQPETYALSDSLRSQEVVSSLLDNVLAASQPTAVVHVIPLLSTLITNSVSQDASSDQSAPPCIQAIVDRIPEFSALLDAEPEGAFQTPGGSLSPPLGAARLKLVEFFGLLFQLVYKGVEASLETSKSLSKLIDLMFKYENNNLLHNVVTDIICIIINSDSDILKRDLFEGCHILKRLVNSEKENKKGLQEPKSQRKGYMGHVIIVSNAIAEAAKSQPYMQAMCDKNEAWKKWIASGLKERNRLESSVLGGPAPLSFYGASEDYDDYEDEDDDEEEGSEGSEEEETLVVKMDVDQKQESSDEEQKPKEEEDKTHEAMDTSSTETPANDTEMQDATEEQPQPVEEVKTPEADVEVSENSNV